MAHSPQDTVSTKNNKEKRKEKKGVYSNVLAVRGISPSASLHHLTVVTDTPELRDVRDERRSKARQCSGKSCRNGRQMQ